MRIGMMTSLVALMGLSSPALAQIGTIGGATSPGPHFAAPYSAQPAYEMNEAEQAGYRASEAPPTSRTGASRTEMDDSDADFAPRGGETSAAPEDFNPVPHTLNAQYADLREHRRGRRAMPSRPFDEAAVEAPSRPTEVADSAPVAPQLVAAAVAFKAYMQKTTAVDPKFKGPAAVKSALERAEAYKIQQLSAGAVAYAALVALQNATFVEGVQRLNAYPQSRNAIANELITAPDNVLQIDGAIEAAGSARAALAGLGRSLVVQGRAVKKAAYTVQGEAWSKKAADGQERRLADAKTISQTEVAPSGEDTKLLMTSLVEYRTRGQSSEADPRVSPTVAKGMALAALMVLGDADEAHVTRLSSLLTDAKGADCLNMAKLNLFQCLSVAGPEYEDVFCLGEHAMTDTGQCVVASAGAPSIPVEAKPVLAVAHRTEPTDVQVPIAISGPARVAANSEEAAR